MVPPSDHVTVVVHVMLPSGPWSWALTSADSAVLDKGMVALQGTAAPPLRLEVSVPYVMSTPSGAVPVQLYAAWEAIGAAVVVVGGGGGAVVGGGGGAVVVVGAEVVGGDSVVDVAEVAGVAGVICDVAAVLEEFFLEFAPATPAMMTNTTTAAAANAHHCL